MNNNKKGLVLASITIVGVIGTGVSAAMATPKALSKLEDLKDKQETAILKRQKFIIMAPSYIPACLIAISTIGCIVTAYNDNEKIQASLVSAYTVVDSAYRQYREKVIEVHGQAVDKDILTKMSYSAYPNEERALLDDGSEMFYDEYSERFFMSTIEDVIEAEDKLNERFAKRGYCELNQFYENLGLEPTEYGAAVGWSESMGYNTYGYTWISFNNSFVDPGLGNPYYVISYPFKPTADYLY